MGKLSQQQINVDLFDEVQRLKRENQFLKKIIEDVKDIAAVNESNATDQILIHIADCED